MKKQRWMFPHLLLFLLHQFSDQTTHMPSLSLSPRFCGGGILRPAWLINSGYIHTIHELIENHSLFFFCLFISPPLDTVRNVTWLKMFFFSKVKHKSIFFPRDIFMLFIERLYPHSSKPSVPEFNPQLSSCQPSPSFLLPLLLLFFLSPLVAHSHAGACRLLDYTGAAERAAPFIVKTRTIAPLP